MSYGPHTRNPYEDDFAVERCDEPIEDETHRSCCFCPLAIDDEETVAIVKDDRVNGYQVAHVGCAVECPACHKAVAATTLVQINPTRKICGTCARTLIEEATGGWA